MRGLTEDEERILRLCCLDVEIERTDDDEDDPVYEALVRRGLLDTWDVLEWDDSALDWEVTHHWATNTLGKMVLELVSKVRVAA